MVDNARRQRGQVSGRGPSYAPACDQPRTGGSDLRFQIADFRKMASGRAERGGRDERPRRAQRGEEPRLMGLARAQRRLKISDCRFQIQISERLRISEMREPTRTRGPARRGTTGKGTGTQQVRPHAQRRLKISDCRFHIQISERFRISEMREPTRTRGWTRRGHHWARSRDLWALPVPSGD